MDGLITPQMKRMLTLANGSMGCSGNIYGNEIFEAKKKGWVKESPSNDQNDLAGRYKITEAGRSALESQ
jgi:hypothetical protein